MKPRKPLSFARALTIVRDRFKANQDLFDGHHAHVRLSTERGCVTAHLKQVYHVDGIATLMRRQPRHSRWLACVWRDSVREDASWAISTLNAKLAQLKRASARRKVRASS